MGNGDSGPGAQWMAPALHDKSKNHADLVRLLGFYGYGMNMVPLRKSPMVDVC